MKKRIICLALIGIMLLAFLMPAKSADLELSAPSAILMEASTGQILYESNADERLRPASVTKIMTLLLVMEALDDGRIGWDDTVTASAAAAAKGGSQIYLEENEQLSMDEMLKSVVVSSANDCACALAEHIAGSESAFVEMMNTRARELGMTNTHFVNCTGLDDEPNASEHLTTARDIAIMSRELLKHSAIKRYTTIWMDTVRNGQFGLSNTNKLVRFYDGTTGLKTGYTSSAGYCLSASAERDGMELIAVVLHCAGSTDRFESAKAMLNYGFSNYALVEPDVANQIPAIPVKLGKSETVTPIPESTTSILLSKSQAAKAEISLETVEEVSAPVEKGQQLGLVRISAEGSTLAEIPLVCPQEIQVLRFRDLWQMLLQVLCMKKSS